MPNASSRVPSGSYRRTTIPSNADSVHDCPATTIRPSGCRATAEPEANPSPGAHVTFPSPSNVGSSPPDASIRARAIAWSADVVPTTTIVPSGPIATSLASSSPPAATRTVTEPSSPKVPSSAPFRSYRTTANLAHPRAPVAVPTTTIFPSGWIATPVAASSSRREIGRDDAVAAEPPVERAIGAIPDDGEASVALAGAGPAHDDDPAVVLDRHVAHVLVPGRDVRDERAVVAERTVEVAGRGGGGPRERRDRHRDEGQSEPAAPDRRSPHLDHVPPRQRGRHAPSAGRSDVPSGGSPSGRADHRSRGDPRQCDLSRRRRRSARPAPRAWRVPPATRRARRRPSALSARNRSYEARSDHRSIVR